MFAYPDPFPTNNFWTENGKAIAPFWSDADIRKEGAVRYATYCTISDRSECEMSAEGHAILNEVNQYIRDMQNDEEEEFDGTWMLISHWDHVHPSPHGDRETRGFSQEFLSKVGYNYY